MAQFPLANHSTPQLLGSKRATYGEQIVSALSRQLSWTHIKEALINPKNLIGTWITRINTDFSVPWQASSLHPKGGCLGGQKNPRNQRSIRIIRVKTAFSRFNHRFPSGHSPLSPPPL